MCIEEVTAFRVDDKLYSSELDAIAAAIQNIGQDLMKSYSSKPFEGLLHHGKRIGELVARRDELLTVPDIYNEIDEKHAYALEESRRMDAIEQGGNANDADIK